MSEIQHMNVHEYEAHHQPHYIYRCYDVDGLLLYIGCSVDARKREKAHRTGYGRHGASRWLSLCMDRFEVDADVHRGRIAGREAERLAIAAENPVFNQQERRGGLGNWARNDIARYLVEHGLTELARATACTCWRESREAGFRESWCEAHMDDETRPVWVDEDEVASA